MKNKVKAIIMALVMLFSSAVFAVADGGDPNVDSGGGNLGDGTGANSWSSGMNGVRVSIVKLETMTVVGTPIDYTNKNPSSNSKHFGKKSKLQYKNGASLTPALSNTYAFKNPTFTMPKVIGGDIDELKDYFCSERITHIIADDFEISYNSLTSGKYKLLLEPIAYLKYEGYNYAMTAHEAALYDQLLSGGLHSKMGSLTRMNLPLALFLERPDLGFPAFSGDRTVRQTNDTILSSLGIGTVSYTPPEEELTPPGYTPPADEEYRINTTVITAVELYSSSEINPDSPATVTFSILGKTYTMSNIVIPEGESQTVWCKWKTPSSEQTVTISVSTNKGSLSTNNITAKIVDLDKSPPPDPKAFDRNDEFQPSNIPNPAQITSARWTVWYAVWHPNWVWKAKLEKCSHSEWVATSPTDGYWNNWSHWVDNGSYVDEGRYDFFVDIYTASLEASSNIMPDERVPTARGKEMKSGYGFNNNVLSKIRTNASGAHLTPGQTAICYFPEFGYQTYWRILEPTTMYAMEATLEFKHNKYSTYNNRVHFTPSWYPDGEYKVYTYLIDAWTPAGMLSMNLTDTLTIYGVVFDDWHVSPIDPS